ncbi:MFS transporter [Rhodococcus wratislaviensis]|uniref:Putative proline/betaine transporter n=1 Tax=Rhodococcus wratislaviensis NBRC 100605 TaxID=1219028 RepID=X0Q0F2_RHOWR|nr:MFS transporter [Rhodococcus wratislaviensis]GAF43611.1 putative major facilitator superfamily transporter [Rhodococcus wratislaviensis NBRC 100605]
MASFLGSALEYYDFFIYGSAAALVFNHVFFPAESEAVATFAALATFGVGYLARPVGGLVLGHFGDRLGRKRVLLLALLIMGSATLAIGFLPTYDQVGILAPVLLVICRLAQGFSAGGEAAGASTLTLEHSPEGRRAFFTSFTMTGYAAGMVIATLVFIPLTSLPQEQLLSWGWRVPFWLSVVMLFVAYFVRTKLDETPVFEAAQEGHEVKKLPVAEVVMTQWREVIRVILCSLFAVAQTIFTVFGLAYATRPEIGIERTTMLWVSSLAIAGSIIVIPLCARLSDRVGRRPVWIAGLTGCAVATFGYFWAISVGSVPLIFLAAILLMTVFYSMVNGLWPSFFPEMFAAPVRYSGLAVGTQIGFLLAGFSPAIGWAILGTGTNAWLSVAIFTAFCMLIAAAAGYTARETYRVPIDKLGRYTKA